MKQCLFLSVVTLDSKKHSGNRKQKNSKHQKGDRYKETRRRDATAQTNIFLQQVRPSQNSSSPSHDVIFGCMWWSRCVEMECAVVSCRGVRVMWCGVMCCVVCLVCVVVCCGCCVLCGVCCVLCGVCGINGAHLTKNQPTNRLYPVRALHVGTKNRPKKG